ncbi:uncharacterized protein LOC116182990 [Photinus pyralis]|nr:uncharacterized protein LOC116166695 [Photinus pyralis]XP_031359440.1 uncharacterized protein LOC116182990 [Photinus pyralis]
MKKVLDSKRSGAGEDDVYVPTLWYYDLLLFTVDQEMPTQSISNTDEEEALTEEMTVGDTDKENDPSQESAESARSSTTNATLQANLRQSKPCAPKQTGKASAKKRHTDFMDYCMKQLESSNDVDEYDAVGIAWGKKLKRMDPRQAIYAESLINKIIMDGMLKKLTETTNIYDESRSSTSTPFPEFSPYTVSSDNSSPQLTVSNIESTSTRFPQFSSFTTVSSENSAQHCTLSNVEETDPCTRTYYQNVANFLK